MKYFLLLLLAAGCVFADGRIVFIKNFPGSNPAYVWISLERSGDAVYKEAVNDDQPVKLKLPPEDTAAIFNLADKLDHFTHPLESGLKVARMGTKTFCWEDGDKKTQVAFNYSLDPNAQALDEWFERMIETEQRFFDLDRTAHFDKLGVEQALLYLEIDWDNRRLVDPEQFLPLLDRVAKNESYMHMARERAAAIAESIRAGGPPPRKGQ
jgi:hypothetical protein